MAGEPIIVLPAYAGMIRRHGSRVPHGHRAPRVCGDDPRPVPPVNVGTACSPRMRG